MQQKKLFICLFIVGCPRFFIATCQLSLAVASRGYPSFGAWTLQCSVFSVVEDGLWETGLSHFVAHGSSCPQPMESSWARVEPVFPELASGFLAARPPGEVPYCFVKNLLYLSQSVDYILLHSSLLWPLSGISVSLTRNSCLCLCFPSAVYTSKDITAEYQAPL